MLIYMLTSVKMDEIIRFNFFRYVGASDRSCYIRTSFHSNALNSGAKAENRFNLNYGYVERNA